MKILITGVAGFVSYYFIKMLEEESIDAQILGIDILNEYKCNYKDFTYKKVDLKDFEIVKSVIDDFKPDYILHLASISSVSQSWKEPAISFVNNTNIFLNIVESLKELGLNTKVLSVGSSEEYGNKPVKCIPLKENCKLEPCNPYAVARVSQEMLSKLYAKYYGINIILTRSFNHIGPKQRDIFVVPSFVKQLCKIKTGKQKFIQVGNIDIVRDFMDVRDVVKAYWLLLQKGNIGEVYNVCSGEGIKLSKIIDTVTKILNISPKIETDPNRIRPDDNMVIIGDNSKLKKDTSWERKYSLEQTLKDMIDYFICEELL